eukprot:TRINITY_DN40595_c0_g1_i1.p1 TRINITY_DN40595_c0_g1~~TRINITY_DN40595_c0_g1_i1.p1  ORF type:complete len:326 (-),score=69.84 TRINITY_DN40595_c0_g1_i1:84-995(-)
MAPLRVLVTGAGGQTGGIVVRKLLERGSDVFTPRAVVRSPESETKLRENLGDLAKGLEVVQGDITKPESLGAAFTDIDALVVATSGMPRLNKLSLVGVIFKKIFTLGMMEAKPSFYFDEAQSPEQVDWLGQKAQFDAAKEKGVKHVVLVSSMAGTKPEHFLNAQMENIVLWKRKAECYLMNSELKYTIIHPGGLLPHFGDKKPAPGGRRELVVGVDDKLMDDAQKRGMVPREDVAEVCVECMLNPDVSQGRSFDLGSGPETETEHKLDIKALLATLDGANCAYTGADADFKGSSDKARNCPGC